MLTQKRKLQEWSMLGSLVKKPVWLFLKLSRCTAQVSDLLNTASLWGIPAKQKKTGNKSVAPLGPLSPVSAVALAWALTFSPYFV